MNYHLPEYHISSEFGSDLPALQCRRDHDLLLRIKSRPFSKSRWMSPTIRHLLLRV